MAAKKKSAPKKKEASKKKATPKKEEAPKVSKEKKSKIFPNVHFNLTVIVYLFALITLLMSGIVHYQTETIVLLEKQVDDLENRNFDDFSYYSYNLDEFSRVAEREIVSSQDIVAYLQEKEFDIIEETSVGLYGKKEGEPDQCFFDRFRKKEVCNDLLLEYNEFTGIVELIVVRE